MTFLFVGWLLSEKLTLWLFNSSPWYRWPIEIDGLPFLNIRWIFHGKLLVITRWYEHGHITSWYFQDGSQLTYVLPELDDATIALLQKGKKLQPACSMAEIRCATMA